MKKIIAIIFLAILFFNCTDKTEPIKTDEIVTNLSMSSYTNTISMSNFYHGEIDDYIKVEGLNLFNYGYEIELVSNTFLTNILVNDELSNSITNIISITTNTNYYTNTSIETNYLEFISIEGIEYNDTIYYYSNSLYNIITNIHFHNNGKIREGQLIDDQTIDMVQYQRDIYFYSNGQVNNGLLSSPITIDMIRYWGNSMIHFYENGQVKQGELLGDHNIDGTNYSGNHLIKFNPDGTVQQ